MRIKHLVFSQTVEQEFSKTLKRRVNLYFKLNKTDKRANRSMIFKTIFMLLIYSIPIAFLISGSITSPALSLCMYFISGLGIAGIGMGIMHDANHGSYTRNKRMNYLLSHTLDLMGCSSEIWKLQHNVLHHTYTNIHGHDEDIDAPVFLLRFSPFGKSYKIQRFQHYYVWFFYGVLTLFWVTVKDFRKAGEYYKTGLIPSRKAYGIRLLKLIPLKLIYFTYALGLPMLFAPFPAYWMVLGFILMHLMAGILLSIVFQLAHVVPNMQFPQADEHQQMNANWYLHQLQTTSNFSPNNRFLFWYLGGLTNQIEHHLFPHICHVHYKNVSKLVARTAADFQIPYHVNRTLFSAVSGHVRTLRILGSMKTIQQSV